MAWREQGELRGLRVAGVEGREKQAEGGWVGFPHHHKAAESESWGPEGRAAIAVASTT